MSYIAPYEDYMLITDQVIKVLPNGKVELLGISAKYEDFKMEHGSGLGYVISVEYYELVENTIKQMYPKAKTSISTYLNASAKNITIASAIGLSPWLIVINDKFAVHPLEVLIKKDKKTNYDFELRSVGLSADLA